MTPLQKRAWWGLAVGLAFAVAFTLVFILKGGIATFDEDTSFRLIIDALYIGGLVANLVIVNVALRKPGMVDERDRLVLDRAPRIQWWAVILTMVAWNIVLTESYHATKLVPSVFLYIMVMSVFIVSALAQSLGIIIGYWRMDRHGQD